jgi:predicted nucleic acid-binding Zn ribbon protein
MQLNNLGKQKPQIQVNLMDSPELRCEACDCPYFRKVTVIKKISKLLTGSPEDQLVPMETYCCDKCGHINEDFDILGNGQ